jgi:hypothetical protein
VRRRGAGRQEWRMRSCAAHNSCALLSAACVM